MEDGVASQTARSVAARRLTYERVPADYGQPEADIALMRDVAAGLGASPGWMHEYIRARTAFFDRVVVRALGSGVRQVVVGAAGYDGRSLRYAKPGVHWFEVDHPATQADKLERLGRLGIAAGHVRFVAADFREDPVAARLREAGLDDRQPALFLFEGIAVYLEDSVTESVLAQFREVTVAGSLLAISVSATSGAREPGSRSRFREKVADMGEPARSELGPDEAQALLARAAWEVRDLTDPADPAASDRSQRRRGAGLLTARAAARPEPGDRVTRKRSRSPVPPDERGLPLHALLSRALVAFTLEADNEAGHRLPHRTTDYGLAPGSPLDAPWLISLAMWASSLRLIPDEGITVAGLRAAARTGTNLPGLRRWRYLTFEPEPTRSKRPAGDAVIRLTAHGRTARDEWARVASEVEDRWRHRFGADALQALRTALEAVAARLPAGLPDSLPILGFGLYSRVAEELPGRDAGIAPDAGAEGVAGLPLWALLSRVLLAHAVEYESESRVSLAISANVLRVLTATGVRVRDIPALAGISKEAVAMAMGILLKFGLATEERDPAGGRWRVARLTPRGERAQLVYHALVADIEDAWRERFGAGAVGELRAALERLPEQDLLEAADPYPDGWRARLPPLAVLPRYPMVLHRGGHPDGSLGILKKRPADCIVNSVSELKAEVEPAEVGLDAARLERIDRRFARYVDEGKLAGWLVTVSRRGRMAYVSRYGSRDAEAGLPVETDTIWRLYSMTKPITSVAAMMLYEEGAFELTDPVAAFIPSFGDVRVYSDGSDLAPATVPVTEPVRIWHLLTHTSGLTYGFHRRHPVDAMYRAAGFDLGQRVTMDLATACDTFASMPLLFQPGAEWAYSVATDVLGRVVEVASGLSLDEFFATRILGPLGMTETGFYAAPEQLPRLAALYARGRGGTAVRADALDEAKEPPAMLSGGAGLVGTAADYDRFTQMLLHRLDSPAGSLDGVTLLSPRTVAYMGSNHLPGGADLERFGRRLYAEVPFDGVGFGLGFAVVIDPVAGRVVRSPGEMSWGGAASTAFWIDPAEELTVSLFTQLVPSSAHPLRSQLRQLVYQALL